MTKFKPRIGGKYRGTRNGKVWKYWGTKCVGEMVHVFKRKRSHLRDYEFVIACDMPKEDVENYLILIPQMNDYIRRL